MVPRLHDGLLVRQMVSSRVGMNTFVALLGICVQPACQPAIGAGHREVGWRIARLEGLHLNSQSSTKVAAVSSDGCKHRRAERQRSRKVPLRIWSRLWRRGARGSAPGYVTAVPWSVILKP